MIGRAHGYGYQGASVTNLTMLSLQPDRSTLLLQTSLSNTSEFLRGEAINLELGCEQILDPKYLQPEGLSLEFASCEYTEVHWRIEGDSVRLTFNWATREADDNGRLKPLKTWKTTTLLQWTGATLKLVEGTLPEFGI